MSIQHNDSKGSGQETTAPEIENLKEAASSATEGGLETEAQSDGLNTVAGGGSAPENDENASEKLSSMEAADKNSANEGKKMPDSDGDAETEGENCPDAAHPDKKIAALEAQLAETRDQLLRKAADFENFRKRMNQEKQNAIEFANQTLLLDIIPIIDDFERAIQSAQNSAELAESPVGKAMLDGITLIEKRLTSQLESKWGLKRFNSAGEPFDPNRHEAMMMEKSSDIEEPVVQEEYSKGYMLKDRVIRAAQVKVVMPEEN